MSNPSDSASANWFYDYFCNKHHLYFAYFSYLTIVPFFIENKMSDEESDVSLSDMELTAEELAEAEQSMAARRAEKQSKGDIVIDLDLESEKKKVFCSYYKHFYN